MHLRLTYADRELLLDSFEALKSKSHTYDESFFSTVTEWAKNIVPKLGFENGLIRDITSLLFYIKRNSNDDDVLEIAQGALSFLIRTRRRIGTSLSTDMELLGDAFVCSYAVHEIQNRLGEPASYNFPSLTDKEKMEAENIFLGFLELDTAQDEELVQTCQEIIQELENLSASAIFKRFKKNTSFLLSILLNSKRNEEHKSIARAALQYLVLEEDVIDDKLGIIGYVDDNFILQLAVDLIEPNREPWLEFLDSVVAQWPFLDDIVIGDGAENRPISEFMLINSALTCRSLLSDIAAEYRWLITPLTGPVPFLLGLISVFGLIDQFGLHKVTEESFKLGQKVLVDYSAVAEFAGFKEINGRRLFGLRQSRKQDGKDVPVTRFWPISELDRLLPVDVDRKSVGKIAFDPKHNNIPLPAIDYLFNSQKAVWTRDIPKKVVVVTPLMRAYEIANVLTLYGQKLKDVIPMGSLNTDEEVQLWSGELGEQEPLLLFVSDLDIASSYTESNKGNIQLVIVDATGRNLNKSSGLSRLRSKKIPTLVVSPENKADEILQPDNNFSLLEWGQDDLSSLLWPECQDITSPISSFENRLQKMTYNSPIEEVIVSLPVRRAFQTIKELRSLNAKRYPERLLELETLISELFHVFLQLIRIYFPPNELFSCHVKEKIEVISKTQERSIFLTDDEKNAIITSVESLLSLLDSLAKSNPKSALINDICFRDVRVTSLFSYGRDDDKSNLCFPQLRQKNLNELARDGNSEGIILPGWYGKKVMPDLLIPPIGNPLYLIIYEAEMQWYSAFKARNIKAKKSRNILANRSQLFPTVKGWRITKPATIIDPHIATDIEDVEEIQSSLFDYQKEKLLELARASAGDITADAQLVTFSDGYFSLMTEGFSANVVTHLLNTISVDQPESVRIEQKTLHELASGDMLLFYLGTDRDAIRFEADKIIRPGTRELSSAWQEALKSYAAYGSLSLEKLYNKIKSAGSSLTKQTIRNWLVNENIIAPQSYKRDIAMIASITGDRELNSRLNEVLEAVSDVRSAHLKVSHQLAKKVISKISDYAFEPYDSVIEIEENLIIVCISDIDSKMETIRSSLANRLLRGDQWLE